MIVTESTVYWITRLDGIKDSVIGLGVVLTIIFAVCIIISAIARFEKCGRNKKATKYLVMSVVCTLLMFLLCLSCLFIPTTKEMCAIKVLPLIINNQSTQELPAKILNLADAWIEDLYPKNLVDVVKD